MGAFASVMERVLLSALGGLPSAPRVARPPMDLADLDTRTLSLQVNSIEHSTSKNYATGARDYINFCLHHSLPLDPTPTTLSRYIAYSSLFIASGPKYLTGIRHFLQDIYPEFDANRAHALVRTTIRGAKKARADPVQRKLPLRLAHLQSFVNVAHCTGTYDDFLFAVLLSCAFYGCHRMGELVQIDGADSHLELSALAEMVTARYPGTEPAILFDNIPGYRKGFRVLSGAANSYRRLAQDPFPPTAAMSYRYTHAISPRRLPRDRLRVPQTLLRDSKLPSSSRLGRSLRFRPFLR